MLRTLALGATVMCFACGGGSNARDVSGQWSYTSDYAFSAGNSCHVTGLVTIDQDGPNVTANIRNDVKPADNSHCQGAGDGGVDSMSVEGLLGTGLVIDSRMAMSNHPFDYAGTIVGDPATQVSGSITFLHGTIGTWTLSRQQPPELSSRPRPRGG